MIAMTNLTKKTALGGTALFLVLLMTLMPMSGFVDNPLQSEQVTAMPETTVDQDDFGAHETLLSEYPDDWELLGMRTETSRTYVLETGEFAVQHFTKPIHYKDSDGVWQRIDLNLQATNTGWEVASNSFTTEFAANMGYGLSIQAGPGVDDLVTGVMPGLSTATFDPMGLEPYQGVQIDVDSVPSVGGNMIRYHLSEGYSLDYTVTSTNVKQELRIEERPSVTEGMAWFGLSEMMRLPADYAVFDGETMVGEMLHETQNTLEIRHVETGRLLATIAEPVAYDAAEGEPYQATYFLQVVGTQVVIATMVEVSWLLDEDRVYPVVIDPTIGPSGTTQTHGGYCNRQYANCYGSATYTSRYVVNRGGGVYYTAWHRFNVPTTSTMLPNGTLSDISLKQYTTAYSYYGGIPSSTSANQPAVTVLEDCGNSAFTRYSYAWVGNSSNCNGSPLSASITSSQYNNANSRALIRSTLNSPGVNYTPAGSYSTIQTIEICSNATSSTAPSCGSTAAPVGHLVNLTNNGGTIYTGERMSWTGTSAPNNGYYVRASSTIGPYMQMVYTGGNDVVAPDITMGAYTGIASYIEGERTFFFKLNDNSGIDTTTGNAPTLHYKVNNASTWSETAATTIGTCGSSATECNFRVTTPDLSVDDHIQYYLSYQDLSTSGANFETTPNGGTSSGTAPSTVYSFWIKDVEDGGTAKKFTVFQADLVSCYWTVCDSSDGYDQQMTYYDDTDEYHFEFDLSDCGTGSEGCFYDTDDDYFDGGNWRVRSATAATAACYQCYGTINSDQNLHIDGGGVLDIDETDGPGMNLIFLWNSTANEFGVVGVGDEDTGITNKLTGGDTAVRRGGTSYTGYYAFPIPGDITGTFAKIDFNATYNSARANWFCASTNGYWYFYRTTSSSGAATSCGSYYYAWASTYEWNGFGLATGYYSGPSTTETTYKVGNVKPTPDTFPPAVSHGGMGDSYSTSRTFVFTIADQGDPASGMNTNAISGGPAMTYRVSDMSGTFSNNWSTEPLSPPSGMSRADCALKSCDWSTTLRNLDRGTSLEYYVTAQDVSTVASTANSVTSQTWNFSVGEPNQVLVIEWTDAGYRTTYSCDFQLLMYDVTNEIEFRYDSNCRFYYDYSIIGYQDWTRTVGATIKNTRAGYINGANPFTSNYRIFTDGSNHGYEAFDLGLTPLSNANNAISGTSNGNPYYFYCGSSYYWNTYKSNCDANVDLPDGFTFEYFGQTFNGSDSLDSNAVDSRLMLNRFGEAHLKSTSSTAPERSFSTWGSSMNDMPYNGNSASKPGAMAPYWGAYTNYYCYDNTNLDCGVNYRVIPFEGKGTDVSADVTAPDPTIWDVAGSPYRINPSGAYLTIDTNLQIEPGTTIQVAAGKGISFDGECDEFTAVGNATHHIRFEGQDGAEWKGLAFTDDCSTSTDDRHTLSYVDFANTSDAAIAAGSRHGSSPSSSENVGNFSMDHVTFSNVGSAFSHGSGQGTVVSIVDFSVSDADGSCFDFAEDSEVTLHTGTMTNCNTDGGASDGGITTVAGSTAGSLHVENVTMSNAYVNAISTDLASVTVSNVSATLTTAQSGAALESLGTGVGSWIRCASENQFCSFTGTAEVRYGKVSVNPTAIVIQTHTNGVSCSNSVFGDPLGGVVKECHYRQSGSAAGTFVHNMTATDYATAKIQSNEIYNLHDVDFGDASMSIVPGGAASTANGPSGDNAILNDVTTGSLSLTRTAPSIFTDIDATDIRFSGNAPSTDAITGSTIRAESLSLSGCGYVMDLGAIDLDGASGNTLQSNCGSNNAMNTVTLNGGSIDTASGANSVFYARNTKLTVGSVDVTGSLATGEHVVKASVNSQVTLIDVSWEGDDCSTETAWAGASACPLDVTSSSGKIYVGGLATVEAYYILGGNNLSAPDHTVTTTLVDSGGAELTSVGQHTTDSNGEASVWVITELLDGTSLSNTPYTQHNIRVFGANGENETVTTDSWYPTGGFSVNDTIQLRLYPAPFAFDQPNMDCSWMANNATVNTWAVSGASVPTYKRGAGDITVSADLVLDGCVLVMEGPNLRVRSTSTNAPSITLTTDSSGVAGGLTLAVNPSDSTAIGTLKAQDSTYPLTLNMTGGVLNVTGGHVRDVKQDSTRGAAIYVPEGSRMILADGGTVFGSSASSADMATVKLAGGSLSGDGGSVRNVAQTGTALWYQGALGTVENIDIRNAAKGIVSYNAAPDIDGFTMSGNDVGIDVYGGMSLPTIYRSPSLAGVSTGWQTYGIDLSGFIGDDYLQVGWNSIWAGGNAHPTYNSYFSQVYEITDRYRVELSDGTNTWNVTSSSDLGYYPYNAADATANSLTYDDGGDASDATTNARGGVPSWDCGYNSYSFGPNRANGWAGYFYNLYRYWATPTSFPSYPSYYEAAPAAFGFDWEHIDGLTPTSGTAANYPYHYWGYYAPTWSFSGVYSPPDSTMGAVGGWQSNYRICSSLAYGYYMTPDAGARVTFPIVDVSASNLTSVKMYVDVLHNRADSYEDRMEIVARSGNDASDLMAANWLRESGVPSFNSGTISTGETGIRFGGNFAAATFNNIDMTSVADEGVLIDGTGTGDFDNINVTGGDYGVRVTTAGRGKINLNTLDLDDQTTAGAYFGANLGGTFTAAITGSDGPAIEFGRNADEDQSFTGLTIEDNSIGIRTASDAAYRFVDSTFDNDDNDFVITGDADIDFVEGTVDIDTVSVTGTGDFERMRSLEVNLTANGTTVSGTDVALIDGSTKNVVGLGTTNTTGIAEGLEFTTQTVSSAGLENLSLTGYQLYTMARVSHHWTSSSDNSADFRFNFSSPTLTNSPGNAMDVLLRYEDRLDAKTCYTSSNYDPVSTCGNGSYLSTRGSREYSDGFMEYGYYTGMPENMSGKKFMLDYSYTYLESGNSGGGGVDTYWHDATIFVTSGYTFDGVHDVYSDWPYAARLRMHNSTVYSIGESGEYPMAVRFGYPNWPDVQHDVQDSTVIGLSGFVAGTYGYYGTTGLFNLQNNTFVAAVQTNPSTSGSISTAHICAQPQTISKTSLSWTTGVIIANNTFQGCGVAVMSDATAYTWSTSSYGNDDFRIEGNTINDAWYYAIWSESDYSDGGIVKDNMIDGCGNGGYYNQFRTLGEITIHNNTITNCDRPIFMRGGDNFHITDNTITGTQNPAFAGISALNGGGDITGNTVTDADGGIAISGIGAGRTLTIEDNTIGFSSDRFPTGAVGIRAENCGATPLSLVGNDVDVVDNALLIDGCDVVDQGSTFTSTGGSGAATESVDILANVFDPANISINVGDSVRWVSVAYYTNNSTEPSQPHSVVSNDSTGGSPSTPLFSSGGTMNLGTSFVHTFDTAGTYEYRCGVHAWMTGVVNVVSGTGTSYQSNGINFDSTTDELELNGTTISGFNNAIDLSDGGDMVTIHNNAYIAGVDAALLGADVDVHVHDSTLLTTSEDGNALDLASSGSVLLEDTDVQGDVGLMISDITGFRWNGGTSTANTTVMTVNGASGRVENMTWTDSDVHFDLGAASRVTSLGNTLHPDKMLFGTGAILYEGSLLSLDVDHLGNDGTDIGLAITSTDGSSAPYVSPSMQATSITIDGDTSDWIGNPLHPSDDAMPGRMSGQGTRDMYVTWDATNLYLGMTGTDLANGDMVVYFDIKENNGSTDGDTRGEAGKVAHGLPFPANYAFWAESGADSPNDGDATRTYALRGLGFQGWSDTPCAGMDADLDSTVNDVSEVKIPWTCLGNPLGEVRIATIIEAESTGSVLAVHPTQTIDSGSVQQNFTEFLQFTPQLQGDLSDGTLTSFPIIYRTYLGSNVSGPVKDFDVIVKADDGDTDTRTNCQWDWDTLEDLNVSTANTVSRSFDILRACPLITGLEDLTILEDAALQTLVLTSLGVDEQDANTTLSWNMTFDTPTTSPTELMTPALNGQTVSFQPEGDKFGTFRVWLRVTDTNGLYRYRSMLITVNNVNDAPIICDYPAVATCEVTIYDGGFGETNVVNEGAGNNSITMGTAANISGSYIVDMASGDMADEPNDDPYTWGASVTNCDAFSVDMTGDSLTVTENTSNEAGGECPITLTLRDNGTENQNAAPLDVDFTILPVNDAPIIEEWDVSTNTVISDGNGAVPTFPWKITLMEDDTNANNLTFDLTAMKYDIDHFGTDLTWTVSSTSTCNYLNYFTATVIRDATTARDLLQFTLLPDAATDVPDWEIDYLNDNGIHQIRPASGDFCPIRLTLSDTATSPVNGVPNSNFVGNPYEALNATYTQKSTEQLLQVRVSNVPEAVPDYFFVSSNAAKTGFDFGGISAVLDGTIIPVGLTIGHSGDEGPYNYDHVLEVELYAHDKVTGDLNRQGVKIVTPPAFGAETVVTIPVLITEDVDYLVAYMDVKTCVDETCDLTNGSSAFIENTPEAHRCVSSAGVQDAAWSCPGQDGRAVSSTGAVQESIRRPALEDQLWCNNILSSRATGDACAQPRIAGSPTTSASNQSLPVVVRPIQASSVPSFAPGIVAVTMAGMFAAALTLAGRRDEELDEELVDDERAVSPVIATILMVAITVVLSGVIFVWANSLADTDTKGVPRVAFGLDGVDTADPDGYFALRVQSTQTPLATQAVTVLVAYESADGPVQYTTALTNSSGVYGFSPVTSDAFVTFGDITTNDGTTERSSLTAGDVIYIRSHDENGDRIEDASITVTYSPTATENYILYQRDGVSWDSSL